jgi:hypothetical protein
MEPGSRRGLAGDRGAFLFVQAHAAACSGAPGSPEATLAHDPGVKRNELIRAATILAGAGNLSDDELAALLVADGFAEAAAYRLVAFLPSAFARPVLEELGVTVFAPASVPKDDGGWLTVELEDQPEYVAALALAREHRRIGLMPHDIYAAIVNGSSEVNAVDNALNEGTGVEGAVVALALISAAHARHVVTR